MSTTENTGDSPPPDGMWEAVKEAVRGSTMDYTSGPIRKAVIVLAIPMVLEMVMEAATATRAGSASLLSIM